MAERLASSRRNASACIASGRRMGKASGCVFTGSCLLSGNGRSVPGILREGGVAEHRSPQRGASAASTPPVWEARLLTWIRNIRSTLQAAYDIGVLMSTVETPIMAVGPGSRVGEGEPPYAIIYGTNLVGISKRERRFPCIKSVLSGAQQ